LAGGFANLALIGNRWRRSSPGIKAWFSGGNSINGSLAILARALPPSRPLHP